MLSDKDIGDELYVPKHRLNAPNLLRLFRNLEGLSAHFI